MDKTSDIPQSVLDSIASECDDKFSPMDRITLRIMQPWRDYSEYVSTQEIKKDYYKLGRQEQLQKDLEFVVWVANEGYMMVDGDYETWSHGEPDEKRYTTIELYQEYLNSKKGKIN